MVACGSLLSGFLESLMASGASRGSLTFLVAPDGAQVLRVFLDTLCRSTAQHPPHALSVCLL